jgi:hypothetical protein
VRGPVTASAAALFLASTWLVLPAINYTRGTAENVTGTVLAQPFGDGPTLIYLWEGDIQRSCDIEIRRTIVDSQNVVTILTALQYDAVALDQLGRQSEEIIVPVPRLIAPGPAVYQVVEVPKCNWMQRLRPVGIPYPPVFFDVSRDVSLG